MYLLKIILCKDGPQFEVKTLLSKKTLNIFKALDI